MKNEDLYVYKKSDFYEDFISSQKEYYEREQVDTLLAEKDKEIAELKKACNDKDEWCLHTLKENRHHKYKRCLAMARWCDSEMNYWYDRIEMEQCPRFKFYDKWHKRWLELAEEPTLAKFLQLIHKEAKDG